MIIQENISLKPYNTFGIDVEADELIEVSSLEDIRSLIPYLKDRKYMILGGGSNVLFAKDYRGLILLNRIKGIEVSSQANHQNIISAYSGEIWHDMVLWTLEHGYYGLENMSFIPGTVGAAPMQNIGAYGVEIKDVFHSLEAVNLSNGHVELFDKTQCQFGYRESVFKRALSGQYFIYKVNFSLSTDTYSLKTSYGSISDELDKKNITNPTPRDISDAVIAIRQSKLPDPRQLGNAGSFFKNPVVPPELADSLKAIYSDMPTYPDPHGVKIPAGWLIEKAGFKGKVIGNTGSHRDQALVIVNYGHATGEEIYEYSTEIIREINTKFGIELEREVNLIV